MRHTQGVPEFMGDNGLEVVLVGSDRPGVVTQVPVPAIDEGDVAPSGHAKHTLCDAADAAGAGNLDMNIGQCRIVAADFHQVYAEAAQIGI